MISPIFLLKFLRLGALLLISLTNPSEQWNDPPFSRDPATLRQQAGSVLGDKHSAVTVLLNELQFSFDQSGAVVETRHLIYRIENQEGVENWAEISSEWEAWHQAKPEIKARVITTDGTEHWLDQTTLTDFPVHEDAPDMYSDNRKYGGPLPAVAPGSIVEEQVVVRDTAPLFTAGTVHRRVFAWNAPVNKTRVTLSHPVSLPFRYEVHLLPGASVVKKTDSGVETITLEQGPLSAFTERVQQAPADVVLFPEIEFSTGTSWHAVASEYGHLIETKLRVSDVQTLQGNIGAKSGRRIDLIRHLVTLLHKNVRYTGVEFGESKLIPQFPSETLKRKYGDCKDKAAFLVTMLRNAGIAADLALLDSGPGRELNTTLPGMGMFDHAIVHIPASGDDGEVWIDATAQFSPVGTLPWMDYGRWALIVNEKTDTLTKIPELTAATNVHREVREFTLAEYGPATIVETDDEIGPQEADYREFYSGDSKKARENGEKYVKGAYLANSLTSLEHGDLSDLEKPSSIKFVTSGKRGTTDLTSAIMAIRVEALFDSLPDYFKSKENDEGADSADKEKERPRTADWRVTPFTVEWQYKITAPAGFKLRTLPPNKQEQIGTISFQQHYSSNADGTAVQAVLRTENQGTRLTVEQAKSLRDAVVKARGPEPIFVAFDHIGHSLLSAGKIKEGLAEYRSLASQHPKDALRKVQLAQELLGAGLAEQARLTIQEAIVLDPKSALAYSVQGTILKNDLVGRPLKKGMNYDGAIAAYKQAVMLDPKNNEYLANLAILLEYDADGVRYSERARLKEAVAQLATLKKLDEEYSHRYDDNVLYDLWYARDYKGMLDYAEGVPSSDVRKGLILAATAASLGSEAALKKSAEITTDDQARGKLLVTAGMLLARVRKYAETADLLSAGARGEGNESQWSRSASIFRNTKPYEELPVDSKDPRSVVQQLYGEMISEHLAFEKFKSLVYAGTAHSSEADAREFSTMMSKLKFQMRATGLPLTTVADLAVSNMHFTVDGDDSLGYKITVESPGAAPQVVYVVRQESQYKMAAFSTSDTVVPEEIAPLVLREIEKNNLVAAKTWLDRARERIHIAGSDDPLAGQPFPYFWTKGRDADVAAIRTAALVLMTSKDVVGPYLTDLIQARTAAKTDEDRNRLTMVLAYAYSAQERWADMLPLAEELENSSPNSVRAFELTVAAYSSLKRLDDWDRLLQKRMHAQPDEVAYTRSSARLAATRGQFEESRKIIKTLIDSGRATENDLNLYAWYALFQTGPIDQTALDVAERANELTKNSNFGILHTLACVDAAAGKPTRGRELLLKAIDASYLEEPNSEVWFGFATIAEQYGELDAAKVMYRRVEKPKLEYPGASYVIAQQRLTELSSPSSDTVKSARH